MPEVKNTNAFKELITGKYRMLDATTLEIVSDTWKECEKCYEYDSNRTKARLGSISDGRMAQIKEISEAAHTLLTLDLPVAIKEIEDTKQKLRAITFLLMETTLDKDNELGKK
jgi:hypothetical protein